MKLKITNVAHHRNGISGAPFHVVLFADQGPEGSRKLGIVFDEPHFCAVLDIDKLHTGNIAFGSNSFRGDNFEPYLRAAIKEDRRPENNERRANAAGIIANYGNGNERENLVDLLTDAMHWCESFGEPFDEFYDTARMHFAAETDSSTEGANP